MNIQFRAGTTAEDWAWIKQRADPIWTEGTKGLVAEDLDTGEIVAMAALDNWTGNSVQIHWAIDNPLVLRHGFIEEIFYYLFTTCDKKILLATIPSNNVKSLKLSTHIGLDTVHTIKDGFEEGVDYILMEMRKENCKWLKERAA
jgi:hypothetical protein